MTLDEVLGRVTNPEDKAFLQKMIADQNSYITKLEAAAKASKTQEPPAGDTVAGMNKVAYDYLQTKMKEDIQNQAASIILQSVSQEVFDAVKPDWLDFLKKNMIAANTTVEFATDAFNLVRGRCLLNKDHAVNKVGKGTTPNPTPQTGTTPQTAGTNAQGVQGVNDIIRQTPPVMTPGDANAQSGIPAPQPNQVKNTRDAFKGLAARLNGGKTNPFQ